MTGSYGPKTEIDIYYITCECFAFVYIYIHLVFLVTEEARVLAPLDWTELHVGPENGTQLSNQ